MHGRPGAAPSVDSVADGGHDGHADEGADVVPAVAQARGRALFLGRGNCSSCHGRDAAGTAMGPSLVDETWLHTDGTAAGIRDIITRGIARPRAHPMPMPPMGGASLSARDIDDLASWVATPGA
jgi:mono/diheme cytochrome c family protein